MISSNVTMKRCFFSTFAKNVAYALSVAPNIIMLSATKDVPIGGQETLPYDKLNKRSILLRDEEPVLGMTFFMPGLPYIMIMFAAATRYRIHMLA